MRGGIFAIFTLLARATTDRRPNSAAASASYAEPLAAPVPHEVAAADATAAAGRLLRARAGGGGRRSRGPIADVDAAFAGGRAAGRRPPPRGRRGDRPRPRSARRLVRRRACARSARSGAAPTPSPPACQFVFPSSPDIGPGLTDAGRGPGQRLRRARDPGRPQPPQRSRLLGRRPARSRGRWSPATPAPTPSAPPRAT